MVFWCGGGHIVQSSVVDGTFASPLQKRLSRRNDQSLEKILTVEDILVALLHITPDFGYVYIYGITFV